MRLASAAGFRFGAGEFASSKLKGNSNGTLKSENNGEKKAREEREFAGSEKTLGYCRTALRHRIF
ncbi:MAG TPA: hypothetical protein VFL19_03830 [Nitrospira sp.]|nr:hypothetical protein [Nitrospira sp.]